jgi:hypothetical protein
MGRSAEGQLVTKTSLISPMVLPSGPFAKAIQRVIVLFLSAQDGASGARRPRVSRIHALAWWWRLPMAAVGLAYHAEAWMRSPEALGGCYHHAEA